LRLRAEVLGGPLNFPPDLADYPQLRDTQKVLFEKRRTMLNQELGALEQSLALVKAELEMNLPLLKTGDVSKAEVLKLQRQAAEVQALITNKRNKYFQDAQAELAKAEPQPSPYFGAQLVSLLYDEAAALSPVQSWLERTFKDPLYDLNLREQNRQTREQLSCGNAFTSLRRLALLDWREVFENISRVEQILRRDPAGVYADMDFATRDRCRRAIEELALASSRTEEQVAEEVIVLASRAGAEADGDERRSHVGTWLVGAGRAELVRLLACR
jgi:cyclic beta-1,2-glucan synthetase